MSWRFRPGSLDPARITRAHWFEERAHWSLCGRMPHGDNWIDDVSGLQIECRACDALRDRP